MRVSNALVCTSNNRSVAQTIKEETNSARSGICIIVMITFVVVVFALVGRRESMSDVGVGLR